MKNKICRVQSAFFVYFLPSTKHHHQEYVLHMCIFVRSKHHGVGFQRSTMFPAVFFSMEVELSITDAMYMPCTV